MLALMQRHPLLISDILSYAERFHRGAEIVSRRVSGPDVRSSYPELARRAAMLANALLQFGIVAGDRVATLAWNDLRHLEAYFGIAGIGAVCHTINPRLFAEQIGHILRDARDRIVMVDPEFLPALEIMGRNLSAAGVEQIIVLSDTAPSSDLAGVPMKSYEEFLSGKATEIDWPRFDEDEAALLCYTSGTTGSPKGVLYSHRATVLHAYAVALPDVFCLRAVDRIMPVVPMYHVNAWGLPFAATLVGAGQVLPGARPTPGDLLRLIREHRVTFSAAVPTVWQGLLDILRRQSCERLTGLRIASGGAACPLSVIEALSNDFGITVKHAWGMTELSPVGLANTLKPENRDWSADAWIRHQKKQGRPPFGFDLRVVDQSGKDVPSDGASAGELVVRGHWVIDRYYGQTDASALDAQGWFHTGDIATIDSQGYVEIVDRAKDIIKSGGEWISSIELENLAVGHPLVAQAAVIAAAHEKWGERPLLIVTPADPGNPPAKADILDWLAPRVARWWLPDDVVIVHSLPLTATGKILKTSLKQSYGNWLLEASATQQDSGAR